MTKRNLFLGGGAVALGLALVALPSPPANSQEPADAKVSQAEQRLSDAQTRLAERAADRAANQQEKLMQLAQDHADRATLAAMIQEAQDQSRVQITPEPGDEDAMVFMDDEGTSWLGVESQDISADKVKELKLPAERGVLLGKIVSDSPAAKAGLKDNDVVTEINGQRVEGEAQFRRMIHEIPAGRSAQFTVWRNGRAQSISVTLGKSEHGNTWFKTAPRAFSFQLPKVEIPEMPDMPEMDWGSGGVLAGSRPRLGIDAEDLSGQFGAYFGAPDGEGVLVREVNSGSPAEKAGVKSGDVITSVNGERIRSLGDLREKLAGKRDEKTVKLGVLRNKTEMSVSVEIPAPASKTPRAISRRTNI